ncbi:F0F1 ATP synthase subunit A [Proteocatella sphenisci]|uniref:F0F1 ATP synthase subunit A n=1 Tax=Proteocatella sphenisci TaxID=181070 RepID=UPI0004903A8C|nr:F0F1 ATP synthase subunit A [Proteocatella sphenisci]
MSIDPSSIIYFENGFVRITATLVFSWITMIIIAVFAFFITRKLKTENKIMMNQNLAELIVVAISSQIKDIIRKDSEKYIPFIGTLFIFILISNILSVIPGYISPAGSMNTTIALALCVFLAVPLYGISSRGFLNYLRQYTKPSILMLPFNIIGEISRTISLAVRLYGNVMSSSIIIAILLGVIPLFFPIIIQVLGLLTGAIQAYIFAILAAVYIASAIKQ